MANLLADDLDNILLRTEPLWKEMRGSRILITGATGFFGCWILESFSWANRRLGLDARAVAMSRNPQVLATKAPHLLSDSSITFYAGNVCSDRFPDGALTHVIHAATEASATLNSQSPQIMFDTIVEGTRNILRIASMHTECRFLLTSSGAVYGTQPPHIPHLEETFFGGPDPLDRASAYAEGKRAAESLCALAANEKFHPAIARCFAFVGPYMKLNAHFAIGNFIADRLNGGPIRVRGDGTPFRSYMYASDLMVWLWTILLKGQPSYAYNVGSEEPVDIAALAEEVAEALPPRVEVQIAQPARPGAAPTRYVPSTWRARNELSLQMEIPLREAIRRTYHWFAHHGVLL